MSVFCIGHFNKEVDLADGLGGGIKIHNKYNTTNLTVVNTWYKAQ